MIFFMWPIVTAKRNPTMRDSSTSLGMTEKRGRSRKCFEQKREIEQFFVGRAHRCRANGKRSACPTITLLHSENPARRRQIDVDHGWVAQLAEQWTENPRVGGSIPPPATVALRAEEQPKPTVRTPHARFCCKGWIGLQHAIEFHLMPVSEQKRREDGSHSPSTSCDISQKAFSVSRSFRSAYGSSRRFLG